MTGIVRILVADDDALVRGGLSMMFSGVPDIVVVAEVSDGDEVVAALRGNGVDLVLMDIRMPRVDGVSAVSLVRRLARPPQILMLTTFDADELVVDALRAGAAGFLLKDTAPEQIVEAIHRVVAGDTVLSPSVTRKLVARVTADAEATTRAKAALAVLGSREQEVVLHLARGASNADIAASLHMSVATVKAHVSHVMTKLGLDNRTQIALLANDAGLS
ncbi:MAG: DNA-binding response regulator [Pseudonocardiales bacterium]|nr:MAG: DNA-binding response regulator [Pseudonocardiales bacterium]